MASKRCALCGAYLDPGEHCDCDEQEPAQVDEWEARRPVRGRQLSMEALYARHMGVNREEYMR